MEEWQVKHIRKNLVELIKCTICNTTLIASLTSSDVLSQNDVETFDLQSITSSEKSKKLYEFLITRVGSFDKLIRSLEETKQSGAVKILRQSGSVFRNHGTISYDKNHLLGSGSLGTKVFKGTFDGRDVAVKVLNTNIIDLDIAKREVEFLKKLDYHENIVRYHMAEINDDLIYIALEHCVISLQDEIKMKIVNASPKSILKQCTKGLAHLHQLNIIHRDLKPANVLLTQNGQVKISDFGLSKVIPVGVTSVSVHSGVEGTLDWMAPEVLKLLSDDGNTNESIKMSTSSDIFSLGCIFHFVLTNGQHPFGEGLARPSNILQCKPQLSHSRLDDSALKLINKMIASSPKDRPSAPGTLKDKYLSSIEVYTESFTSLIPATSDQVLSNRMEALNMQTPESLHKPTATSSAKLHLFENKADTTDRQHNTTLNSRKNFFTTDIPGDAFKEKIDSIKEGQNVITMNTDEHGRSLFNAIVENKSLEEIKMLVERGDNWKAVDEKGKGVLHYAAEVGKKEAIIYFVSLGAEVNLKDTFGFTPLQDASLAEQNMAEIIQVLLENGADIRSVSNNGNNLLLLAANYGRLKPDLDYIISLGVDWRSKNNYQAGILHMAAAGGNVEALRYFISLGADIYAKDEYGETPVLKTSYAERNLAETIKFLLENGADAQSLDNNGNNLLLLAIGRGRTNSDLEYIMKLGLDWHSENNNQHGILHMAAQGGNLEATKYFISLGANVNSKDKFGYTPLHHLSFAEQNFSEVLTVLLENGALINARTNFNSTLLGLLENEKRDPTVINLVKSLGGRN